MLDVETEKWWYQKTRKSGEEELIEMYGNFTNVYWFCEHRTKFVYYFPRMHDLILQPQLQTVK